ncbi:MAG: hypothetical protein M0R39_03590 [Prolixibacteraceae bacterium]|nr:hypothetical protein [Prolixibacteraceae bacterium]
MSKKSKNNSLITLNIGITGHRDIRHADREILKQLLIDFIKKKQNQCSNTPIVLLTPLAEGADQIAALAAIDCKIDFNAVLPMPVEEYKRDFVSAESLREFESLLAKASLVIELPLQEGTTIKNVNSPVRRNEQYYQNGLFLARHCHTLIALWDGINNNKKGGTADVVKLKKSGIPGKFEDKSKRLHYLQTGPIYHIVTPRKSNPVIDQPLPKPISYPTHYGEDLASSVKHDEEIHKRIDSFNKDFTKKWPDLQKIVKESAGELFANHPDLANDKALHNIAEKYAIAGELSNIFQKKRFRALQGLLFLVVLAFFFLHSNAEFFHEPLILLLYPLTMGIGAIWFFIARRKHYEYKHEDYRALSEAYRIQFFLKACGKNDNVSDHYLKRHRGELEWVLYTLRTSLLNDWESENKPVKLDITMRAFIFLKTNWVNHQLEYFNRKTIEHNNSSKNWSSLANYSFIIAILSACLLFLISYYKELLPENIRLFEEIIRSTLSCCTSVFLVLAAALHGYSDKMIFAEQAKNYHQMAQLFQLASDKLNHAIETNDVIEANDIIGELAQEALLENGDWLLLHRSRPLEIPKG